MSLKVKYRPLQQSTAEIRLVRILPPERDGQPNDGHVACRLEYVNLDDLDKPAQPAPLDWDSDQNTCLPSQPFDTLYEHEFAALSYTWGDPNETRTIVVDGSPVLVRCNLEAALRELRKKKPVQQGLRIWIDALCINQDDIPERNREVKRMRAIYKNARDVVVWLGEEGNGSRKAMSMIRTFARSCEDGNNDALADKIRETPDLFGQGSWKALGQLLGRCYWDRVWIIQELSMGNPQTPILCGDSMVLWSELHGAIYTFGSKNVALVFNNIERDCKKHGFRYSGLNRNRIIHLWQEQAVQAGSGQPQYMPLLDLGRKAFATDMRDKVYGLMGLLPVDVAAITIPDYAQEVNEVFIKFATAWIKSRQNLEILEQCTGVHTGLPSWVPDWTNRDHYRLFSGRACYKAGPGVPTVQEFSANGLELTVKGVMIGELDGLGVGCYHTYDASSSHGHMHQSKSIANGYGSDEGLRDAVWRTFVGDRTPTGRSAPDEFASLLNCPITIQGDDGDGNTSRGYRAFSHIMGQNRELKVAGKPLKDFFLFKEDAVPKECKDALERIFRLHRGRKLATTLLGHLGLVPIASRRGDAVFVLQGCNVPMVLRGLSHNRYQIVGGAYLQGFMAGEAIQDRGGPEGYLQRIVLY